MWRSLMVLAAFSLSGAAYAEGFDYSFIEGSYSQIDVDGLGDGDGLGVGGSYAFTDSFHAFGSFETGEIDVDLGAPLGTFGVDVDTMKAGVGYNMPLSDNVDLIATAAYMSLDMSVIDDTGYEVGVGLRAMASPAIELSGGIEYADVGDLLDGETSFSAGFLYHFSDAVAVGAGGSWGDDMSSYALNGRFSFGQ
jgi:Outer membrane protein beta-barrel domain